MRPFLIAALVLVACSKRVPSTASEPEAGAPLVAASVTSAAIVDAAPEPKTYRASYAKITNDILDQCLDVSYVGAIDAGGGDPDEIWAKRVMPKDKTAMVLKKRCDAQFPDRTPLATCTIESKNGDAGVGSIVVRHYAYESIALGDAAMKDCLHLKGDWDAVSRDSREWHAAKMEYSQRQLRKLAGQAGVAQ